MAELYDEEKQRWVKEYTKNWTEAKQMMTEKDPLEVEAWFAKKCGFGKRGWTQNEPTEEEKKDQIENDHLCCEAYGLYKDEPIKL
jgi:hypothetical protein